ncbi:beta strand repeat-containing protein [Paraburkholderia sp. RL18-085-BIA-A]|uniref:beta strand repeat-containing protein n=1 Tax=Paraburkholderia sp. RL18-085-BIA-A TaxID=3031633 RepID=UPI0038BA0D9E
MAALSFAEQVQQAYLAYYGRPADPAGQQFWVNQLTAANGNLNTIINAFGNSAESTALYGGSSTAAQVNAIYQTLFGRSADVTGLNFYVNGIVNGTFTLASVALNIYNGATGTDATELAAKLGYADAFTTALSQSAAGEIAYSGTAASNNARAAVAAVVDTTTEASATAALPTTIANIGTGTVGQTVTLTTGVDNAVGAAAGNTVFNAFSATATPGTTGDTLTSADIIQGNGTGNVLNITNTGTTLDATAGAQISGIQTVNIRNTGISGTNATTLDASKIAGVTAVNSTSTGDVVVQNLAAGASAGIVGNGTLANGTLIATYVAGATAATLNLSGGVKEAGTATINGAGITSTTVNSTGAANKLGGLTLAATDTALTINAATNLTTGAITDAALKTITVTGAAAQVDISGGFGAAVTKVDASGMTAGGVKVTLANPTTFTTFVGGAKNNFVTTGGVLSATGASINAGTGTGNTLDVANTADIATAALAKLYTGFNTLQVESGVAQDASLLAATNTITAAVVNDTVGAAAATSLTNLASGVGVTIGNSANATAGAGSTIDYSANGLTLGIKGATTVGQIDTLNVTVNDSVSAGAVAGSSVVKLGSLTVAGVENVAFHVANAGDTLNITDLTHMGSASSITFDGVGSASMATGAVTPIANSVIDAHSLSGTFTLDASLATTNAIAVKGSVGANTITLQNSTVAGDVIDLSANTKGGSTITTGALTTATTGNATITLGTHAAADTISIADGAFVDGGTGAFTLVNNFAVGATAATSDILKFSAAGGTGTETIATATTFTAAQTGVANLTATTSSGLITFAGSALSTATVAQLISAAEKVVVGAIDTVAAFVNGGNTYVVESTHGGTLGAASTHVVELVGVSASSIGTAAGAGVLHIA